MHLQLGISPPSRYKDTYFFIKLNYFMDYFCNKNKNSLFCALKKHLLAIGALQMHQNYGLLLTIVLILQSYAVRVLR